MPKMKTHSATKKRFKKTGKGKIKMSKAFRRHHAWAKETGKKRKLRSGAVLEGQFGKNIAKLLPYQ